VAELCSRVGTTPFYTHLWRCQRLGQADSQGVANCIGSFGRQVGGSLSFPTVIAAGRCLDPRSLHAIPAANLPYALAVNKYNLVNPVNPVEKVVNSLVRQILRVLQIVLMDMLCMQVILRYVYH
jgi:hypothetical protein